MACVHRCPLGGSVRRCRGGGVASATTLIEAVASYNASAAGIQPLWNTFQSAQQAAFNDVKDWLNGLYYNFYYLGTDQEQSDAYWQDSLDAIAHFENVTEGPVDPALSALLTRLEQAATGLQQVMDLDAADPNFVACPTGNVHFELPAQPFLFWKDEDCHKYDAWMEFTFPELAVHRTGECQPVVLASGIGEFLGFISDLWDWIKVGAWFNRHKTEGPQMNSVAAAIFDFLCANCDCEVLYTIQDDCFTQELLDDFCEVEHDKRGEGDCWKNLSAREKNATINEKFPCYKQEQLDHIKQVVGDYLCSSRWSEFEWME